MTAAEQLKAWGTDQFLGLFVVVCVLLMCGASTRRFGTLALVGGFALLVAVESMSPGTVTK